MREQESAPPERGGRWRAVRFVITFSVCVLLMLGGYRAITNTALNDRYLLQVAWHTTWVLHRIGDSAYLEYFGFPLPHPAQARADLAAWERGEESPTLTPEELEQDTTPLTPWESWRFRALSARRADGDTSSLGPNVTFFMTRGLLSEQKELVRYGADLGKDADLSRMELLEKRNQLDARKSELAREIHAIRNDPDADKTPLGKIFSFSLVSECGAIEVMAIFIAAVIAFPTRWWKRLVGLLVGVPLMYGVNIFRLACLGVIGALDTSPGNEYFNFAHHYVWQSIYVVFVVAVWLLWVELLVKKRKD